MKRGDYMSNKTQVACTNVFKNGNEILLKKEFNQRLIELINQVEKNKTSITYKSDLQVNPHKI